MHENDVFVIKAVLKGYNIPTDVYLSARGRQVLDVLLAVPEDERALRAVSLLPKLLTKDEIDQLGFIGSSRPPSKVVLSVDDLNALPPLTYLIQGEIPERALIVLYGESGVGKSFVALDYSLQIANQGIGVMYVPTEGLRGYQKRVQAWTMHHKKKSPKRLSFYAGNLNLFDRQSIDAAVDVLNQYGAKFVVIDTLAMSMIGADENSARDMAVALSACRRLIDGLNASVMLVHHSGKASHWERGSSALRGNADVMIRVSSADEVLVLECTKSKDFEAFPRRYMALQPVTVKGEPLSLVATPIDAVQGARKTLTRVQTTVLETLTLETCADGVTLRDLAELTTQPYTTLHRAVSNCMKQGWIEKARTGYKLTVSGRAVIHADPSTVGSENGTNAHAAKGKNGTEKPSDPLIHTIQHESQERMVFSVDQVDQAKQAVDAYYRSGM